MLAEQQSPGNKPALDKAYLIPQNVDVRSDKWKYWKSLKKFKVFEKIPNDLSANKWYIWLLEQN